MGIWSVVGGLAGGVGGFFVGGPAGAVAGASIGYGLGGTIDANANADAAANNQFRSTAPQIDPNAGIGQGSFGMTEAELARQRQLTGGVDFNQLQDQQREINRQAAEYVARWQAENPAAAGQSMVRDPVSGEMKPAHGIVNPASRALAAANALRNDPGYQEILARQQQVNDNIAKIGPVDMSDPGRFAAMAQDAQNRQGLTMTRYGVDKTAAPGQVDMNRPLDAEIYEMQRQNAPALQEMQRFGVDRFNAQTFDIDPTAGDDQLRQAGEVRAKNMEVMGAVGDRAMGRGGPSVAELQLKQGQDRAISQQAALAASGGQMDYAQARRQAMLGAADISQKTAADQAILRANEQIAAQNTFGGMASAQQGTDLNARGQTMNQANQRAQFLSGQALSNAQFQAQQAQYASQLAASQERDAIASRVGQMQFGAQFGLNQEQAIAQSLAQQRQFNSQMGFNYEQERARQAINQGQFNAQFGSQQDQWAAQFQAQQEMNQAGMYMQQRGMNDQYQQMLMNQYMASRGMQQANQFEQGRLNMQAQGINSGVAINNQNAQMQNAASQRQQSTAMIGMGATMMAGGMQSGYFGGGASPGTAAPAVANSGFSQGDPNKIDWGY